MKRVLLRLLEIVLACLLLFIFVPVMLTIAISIIIDSGMPILFMSPRIGKNGAVFDLLYFRTMLTGEMPPEKRLTRVGRFLRNYSLDHLPQLFNLLRGDIHIVGPRPMTPTEVDMNDDNYQSILEVKPGMFSPAILQLGNSYNRTDFASRVRFEKVYLDERSVMGDIRLIIQSIRALHKSRGNIKERGTPRPSPEEDW